MPAPAFIIYGWKGREKQVDQGVFFCPQCGETQDYAKIGLATWFTLYFIPIFPMTTQGEYVRCEGCRGSFDEAVLALEPPGDEQRMLDAVRADLEAGTPLQMAQRKLVNGGIDKETARQTVSDAAAGGHRTCTACGLTYLDTITRCNSCGGEV